MAVAMQGDGCVLEKLKRHEEFADKSDEELLELAHDLTDFDAMFRRFKHLLEPVVDKAIDEALIDYRAVCTHSREVETAHNIAKHELARVFHLPVKLFLSRLSQPIPLYSIAGKISNFFLEYGALHAGLVVGNIRIEWGQESIVEALPEDEVPSDDFVGTVDVGQGHLARAARDIQRRFSLADRERRFDDKIKLIIDTAEKKKEVLSMLVRVITSYNLEKKYDLFTCNCQHFVRDALAALGIREPPRFSGQLKHHLERLKQGKVEVPEDFKNHDTLDAYVEEQLRAEAGKLNQHDMEYLLLHYYRLHLNSMPEEETEEWSCSVPSCKYEDLADRVNRESLLNHQSLLRRSVQRFTPSTPTISEQPVLPGSQANGGVQAERPQTSEAGVQPPQRELTEEEQRREQIARDEQRAREMAAGIGQVEAYERHTDSGYYARVVAKVRNHPLYAEASDEKIEEVVANLTECELFRTEYDCFPATVEETSKGYALEATADREWIEAERLPESAARSNVEKRFEKLSKLPVKLIFQVKRREQAPVSVSDARLDPLLLIFDHVFKWDESSLVVPQRVDLKKLPPILMTSILCGSEWSSYINDKRSKVQKVVKGRSEKLHKREIDLVFKLTMKKDSLVAAVIKTVIDYNRNKQYHISHCNNGHFIQDVTAAMGIKNLRGVRESLGTQLEQSRRLCVETLPRTDFVDHADLDAFVGFYCESNSLSVLNIYDIEYLICKYFQFHVRQWELLQSPEQWTCQQENCQLKHLEEQLEKLSLAGEKKCIML